MSAVIQSRDAWEEKDATLLMRHPLGFDRNSIHLFGFRISLHRWNGDIANVKHNHCRSFFSVPLVGSFLEFRYRAIPGSDFAVHETYSTEDGSCGIRDLGTTSSLARVAVHVRKPFHPYVCHLDEVHWSYPTGTGRNVSLCFFGRVKRDTSTMYKPNK